MSDDRPTLPQQLLEPEEWAAFAATWAKIAVAARTLSELKRRLDDEHGSTDSYAVFIDYWGRDTGIWTAGIDVEEPSVIPVGQVMPEDLRYPAEAEMRMRHAIKARDAARARREDDWRRRSAVANLPPSVRAALRAAASAQPHVGKRAPDDVGISELAHAALRDIGEEVPM